MSQRRSTEIRGKFLVAFSSLFGLAFAYPGWAVGAIRGSKAT